MSIVEAFVSILRWYPSSPDIARCGGRLRYEYAHQGVTLGLPDLLIAATALVHDLTLITANRKHFPMPELAVHSLSGD